MQEVVRQQALCQAPEQEPDQVNDRVLKRLESLQETVLHETNPDEMKFHLDLAVFQIKRLLRPRQAAG